MPADGWPPQEDLPPRGWGGRNRWCRWRMFTQGLRRSCPALDNPVIRGNPLVRKEHRLFQVIWWVGNLLLFASLLLMLCSIGWEFSVRAYLRGFSDAIVPATATPEQKVETILDWMRAGPPRTAVSSPTGLAQRDPETTLNYEQLLSVCGTATNAFLNLARSSGLQVRRLLLLTPQNGTKHVVAEVLLDNRWIIVDPTYRVIMRDAQGRLLTRSDLQNPATFSEVTSKIEGYRAEYSYEKFVHVRLAGLPLQGFHLRLLLNSIYPRWDQAIDWSLVLERESLFVLCASLASTALLLIWRFGLGLYADKKLGIRRVSLRQKAWRAGTTLFSPPEIK